VARVKKYRDLEQRLGYDFRDSALLTQALTHASVRTQRKPGLDNERLEFLGDRVLGLVAAELLSELYPDASEGDLARLFNKLVRGETCAEVAREIGLADHLVLGDSEVESGGRGKVRILADAIEAVLGAIFKEAGYEAAREVATRHWLQYSGATAERAVDAKSALQEWAQGNGFELPRYVEVARLGPDHAPHFTSEVRVGERASARGEGASKRAAEQAAAAALLVGQGIWKDTAGR